MDVKLFHTIENQLFAIEKKQGREKGKGQGTRCKSVAVAENLVALPPNILPRPRKKCSRTLEKSPPEEISKKVWSLSDNLGNVSKIVGNVSKIVGKASKIVGRVSKIVGDVSKNLGRVSKIVGNVSEILGTLGNFLFFRSVFNSKYTQTVK